MGSSVTHQGSPTRAQKSPIQIHTGHPSSITKRLLLFWVIGHMDIWLCLNHWPSNESGVWRATSLQLAANLHEGHSEQAPLGSWTPRSEPTSPPAFPHRAWASAGSCGPLLSQKTHKHPILQTAWGESWLPKEMLCNIQGTENPIYVQLLVRGLTVPTAGFQEESISCSHLFSGLPPEGKACESAWEEECLGAHRPGSL